MTLAKDQIKTVQYVIDHYHIYYHLKNIINSLNCTSKVINNQTGFKSKHKADKKSNSFFYLTLKLASEMIRTLELNTKKSCR